MERDQSTGNASWKCQHKPAAPGDHSKSQRARKRDFYEHNVQGCHPLDQVAGQAELFQEILNIPPHTASSAPPRQEDSSGRLNLQEEPKASKKCSWLWVK